METLSPAVISTQESQIVTVEFDNPLRDETNAIGIKHLPINRDRNKRHVKELANDITKNGFTTVITVFKNETGTKTYVPELAEGVLYILDGSHRFDAANEAKSDIRYMLVSPDTSIKGLKDVSAKLIGFNDKSKVWSLNDYILHHSAAIKDYGNLNILNTKYKFLQLKTIASYLFTGKLEDAKSSSITKLIREGDFRINMDWDKATELFDKTSNISKHVPLAASNRRDFNIFLICHILNAGDSLSTDTLAEFISLNVGKVQRCCAQKETEDREQSLKRLFAKCK